MTREQIITQLFTGKNFNDCIRKMEPEHLRDDLRMEVVAIVCEWPDDKIIGLYQRKELDFYVVRVILNQIQSDSSPFYKKFRKASGDVIYEENRKENYFIAIEHYERMPGWREHENVAIASPSFLEEEEEMTGRQTKEEKEEKMLQEIDSLHWYNAGLLRLYAEHGNFRSIQKATGIPYVSCYRTIAKSIQKLKEKIPCLITT